MIEEYGTWVQDAKDKDVSGLILAMTVRNAKYLSENGSEYILGPPRSGKPGESGIYIRGKKE